MQRPIYKEDVAAVIARCTDAEACKLLSEWFIALEHIATQKSVGCCLVARKALGRE